MLCFAAAIAVLIKIRYVAVHGPVSRAIARFIMGERTAVSVQHSRELGVVRKARREEGVGLG